MHKTLGLLGLGALLACAPPNAATPYPQTEPPIGEAAEPEPEPEPEAAAEPHGIAKYFDREVDLAPFLAGFPYGRWKPSLRTGKLFFYELGPKYTLKMLDLGSDQTLQTAPAISDVDWSKRSLWSVHHVPETDTLWMHADASNDEQMNLWKLDLGTGKLEQITNFDYVYSFGFNESNSLVAYLPRQGKKAPFSTCLRVRNVADGTEREVVCDSPTLTFTWSDPVFSPDDSEVYLDAQVKGDRNRVQVVKVDLKAKKPKIEVVTNRRKPRNSPELLDGWLGDELLFTANDDGYRNLYAYDRVANKVRQITKFDEDVRSAHRAGDMVVGVHGTPAGSTLFVVDPKTGKVADERKLVGTAQVADAWGDAAWMTHTSPDVVFEAYDIDLSGGKLAKVDKTLQVDPELEKKIVACKATAVKIPTFDKDPKTKETRLLHAFLLEPRAPQEDPQKQLAMMTAFYGGSNSYSKFDQIMCAAGITVVSPAVRGSSGFGKAFYSLNDKDLGGDEIIDLFYVAKWLEERYGLPSRRIGVYGGSHGGYATMRALTFPPKTNGRNEFYPLGFGMAHAGFSDIKTFYDATNIPDWVVLESGDPNNPVELARMKDRSPLSHVDLLTSPILLTHGSQDWRVPVDESRQFAAAARELKRPVNYVEIEGQGHHIEGLELQVQVYQARFDFLMAVASAAPVADAK